MTSNTLVSFDTLDLHHETPDHKLSHNRTPPPTVLSTAPVKGSPEWARTTALFRFALSISFLNIVGHLWLGFEQPPLIPLLTLTTAYVSSLTLEKVDSWAYNRKPEYAGGPRNVFYFLLPAHISALACGMLIYTDNPAPYIFATVVAIATKYVFRVRVRGRLRHFLNPSNAGISLALLMYPTVGFTPPYMFTNNTDQVLDALIPLAILTAGTMLNANLTKRMPLIGAWILGFAAQGLIRHLLLGDAWAATLGTMTGVAFILYTNYMISDPGTTPMRAWSQVGFGLSVAAVYGLLVVSQVSYGLFFSLTLVCIGRGVLLATEKYRKRQP